MSKPSQQIVLEQLACFVVLTYVGVMIVNNWYFKVVPNKWWLNDWHPPKTNTSCFFREWEIAPVILKFYFGNSMGATRCNGRFYVWRRSAIFMTNVKGAGQSEGGRDANASVKMIQAGRPSKRSIKVHRWWVQLVSLALEAAFPPPQLVAQVDFRWFYLFRTNSQ